MALIGSRRRVGVLVLLVASACGGRVEQSGGDAAAAAAAGDAGFTLPSQPLGPCVKGHPFAAGSCPYIGDGLCYDTKLAACNCVCPKDHDSICTSDYPDPSGAPAIVSCG